MVIGSIKADRVRIQQCSRFNGVINRRENFLRMNQMRKISSASGPRSILMGIKRYSSTRKKKNKIEGTKMNNLGNWSFFLRELLKDPSFLQYRSTLFFSILYIYLRGFSFFFYVKKCLAFFSILYFFTFSMPLVETNH